MCGDGAMGTLLLGFRPVFVRDRNVKCHAGKRLLEFRFNPLRGRKCAWSVDSESFRELTESRGTNEDRLRNSPREMRTGARDYEISHAVNPVR